ncbi:unknown [Roseburia sp. CAG:182]|nr:unknown [Roseburia sp. CAG:182]
MSKTIKVNVELNDKEAKRKLKNLQDRKYEADLEVNKDVSKQAAQSVKRMGLSTKNTSTVFDKLKNAIQEIFLQC